jgi:hypothetical protein
MCGRLRGTNNNFIDVKMLSWIQEPAKKNTGIATY